MRVGTVEVGPGQKGFGQVEGPATHARFVTRVPVHVLRGAADGPVLAVQAGVSGLEIEPAMVLPQVVAELDPAQLKGTLIVAPLLNTSGFEFEQINAIWDDKNLNRLGRGNANGTISEQLIDRYYHAVIARADALLDIRTGAQWAYYRYAGVYRLGSVERSLELAKALALPHVLLGQPEDHSIAAEAARDGRAVVSTWIGGGPGLRDYHDEDMGRVRRAVLNALRALGMLDGTPDTPDGPAIVVDGHTYLTNQGERGLVIMNYDRRGTQVAAGEPIGYVRHPFTGDVLERITAPRAGLMLHAGGVWPMLIEGVPLAILGDVVMGDR